ncbi:unnamed protein product [Trichobilharzia regenti]|nr:unnamed protein product [Trichobilharzia regenti]
MEATAIKERLANMYNQTQNLIKEAEKYVDIYSNMRQDKFDETLRSLQEMKLNVSQYEAQQIIQQLEQYAVNLEDKVIRILAETEADRQRTGNLLRRAENIRDKAKDFAEQINQLKEADKIYQELSKKAILQKVDDIELFDQISQDARFILLRTHHMDVPAPSDVVLTKNKAHHMSQRYPLERIDGFKNQVNMFTHDSSLQSDMVREASEIAQNLLSSTNVARRETLDTQQQIELVEVSS